MLSFHHLVIPQLTGAVDQLLRSWPSSCPDESQRVDLTTTTQLKNRFYALFSFNWQLVRSFHGCLMVKGKKDKEEIHLMTTPINSWESGQGCIFEPSGRPHKVERLHKDTKQEPPWDNSL